MSNYNNNSISTLEGAEQVRQKPAVIFGTSDIDGCSHSVFEIIANAIDEAREGYGTKIDITVKEDDSVIVQDYGRGVPMDYNSTQDKFNWELVYCTLYASGKYNSNNYSTSLGLNGLGCTATQYASEYMVVTSIRDGYKYTMRFAKGNPDGELQKEPIESSYTGTKVEFKPDTEVFTDVDVSKDFYIRNLQQQAMLHKGLIINLDYKGEQTTFEYKDGAKDYLKELNTETKDIVSFSGQTNCLSTRKGDYKLTMELTLNVSIQEKSISEVYHNGGYLVDGGVTFDSFYTSACLVLEQFGKSENKLAKTDKVLPKYLDGVLHFIGATSSVGEVTEYKNQTKTAITNKEIREAYKTFVYQSLTDWLAMNKEVGLRIISAILINKKAYDSAEAIKKNVLKKLTQGIENPRTLPDKFVDCQDHNASNSELWIVEGDSALGSCVQARDSKYQAIIPVRGKITNCLKKGIAEALNSDIIVDLIRVLGCGVEAHTKQVKDLPPFNIANLKWDKVIICTDADIDGMQIRCLILAMFYRLTPSLLGKGKVYIAETPLFEITTKDNTYFAYTDGERDSLMAELDGKGIKYSIQRSKGLGENEPEMMWTSTMCPATRKLIRAEKKENDLELVEVFNALLGDDIQGRKDMINEHFNDVKDVE